MNLNKINKHIIDMWMGKDSSKIRVGKTEEFVGIATDGFCLFVLEHKDFIFNYKRLENDNPFTIDKMIKQKYETESVKLTGDIKVVDSKQKIVKFANDNKHTFVREKHVNYFSKDSKFRIDETVQLSPVYVFNGDVITGVIMPYNLKQKEV